MSELVSFLRDPMWQFIGVLAGVASIVVAIIVYAKQSGTKRLEYTSRAVPLLRVDSAIRDDVRISYRGESVTDVNLVEVRLSNTGRVPIQVSDFQSPLKIYFGGRATVLGADVVEVEPADLDVRCIHAAGDPAVTIMPLLLNSRDTFVVRCLVTAGSEVTLKARIAGVSRLEQDTPAKGRPTDSSFLLLLVGLSLVTEFLPLPFFGTLLLLLMWQRLRREIRDLEITRDAA